MYGAITNQSEREDERRVGERRSGGDQRHRERRFRNLTLQVELANDRRNRLRRQIYRRSLINRRRAGSRESR